MIFGAREAPFGSAKIWRILNQFGIFLIRFESVLNRTGRHCAGRPRLSAPDAAAASLPLTHSRTQPLPTGPLTSSGPACQPPAPASLAPRRPPLSRGNGATCAHRPGVDAGHPSCPPPRPGPPLSPPFSPSTWHRTPDPLPPFSSLPAPPGCHKSHRRPRSPFLPVFLLHPLHALPPPSSPPSLSAPSPDRLTASPPEVRATPGIESPPPR
jgi:hypothetical protein